MSSELPLFPPGFHDLSIDSLYSVFVEPFPGSLNRPRLLKGLEEIISILLGFPLTAEIWINGSFSTRKNDPGDVDVLILTNIAQLNSLSFLQQQALRNLVNNKAYSKTVYFCDLFLITEQPDPNLKIYWRGCFGFDRLDQLKGIPRIFL